jgi:hypothetical protein
MNTFLIRLSWSALFMAVRRGVSAVAGKTLMKDAGERKAEGHACQGHERRTGRS